MFLPKNNIHAAFDHVLSLKLSILFQNLFQDLRIYYFEHVEFIYFSERLVPSKRNEQIRPILQPKKIMNSNPLTKKKRNEICIDSLDYRQKVLHSDWHPNEHIIAVAATNRLLIYDSKNSPASKK